MGTLHARYVVIAALLAAPARSGHAAEPAIDATLSSGFDQDLTAIGRFLGGGLLGFGRVGLEAHLAFEGFLRLDEDRGISARSLTLLDVGARYGFSGARFTGPFVVAGAGYGLIGGRPRERKLENDTATCSGYDAGKPGACTFEIDRNISTRLGAGWGFASGERTTVAVRLDFTYWFFSVADTQERGSPPAGRIDKPQTSASLLLGLEFLHWL
jgi:hypothetical protein